MVDRAEGKVGRQRGDLGRLGEGLHFGLSSCFHSPGGSCSLDGMGTLTTVKEPVNFIINRDRGGMRPLQNRGLIP